MTCKCFNCGGNLQVDQAVEEIMPTAFQFFLCDQCGENMGDDNN